MWKLWLPRVLPWVYRAIIVLVPIVAWREHIAHQREIGRRTLLLEQAVAAAARHQQRADSLAAIVLPAQVDTLTQVVTRWRQGKTIVDTLPPDTVRIPTPVFIAREALADSAFARCEGALSTCALALAAKDSVIAGQRRALALLPTEPARPPRRLRGVLLALTTGAIAGLLLAR
jgi:hypothetical protein